MALSIRMRSSTDLHPFSPALCPVRWVLLLIPLTDGLPSIPLAYCGLFENFSDTMPPSDCPLPSIIGLRPWISQCSPVYHFIHSGVRGLSQFPRKMLPCMYRAFDCAEILPVSLVDGLNVAFRRY